MLQLKSSLAWAALLGGGLLLGACGSNNASNAPTTTPTSTLGTDSAATKVGGTAPADTTGAQPMGAGTSAPSTGQPPQ